MFSLDLDQRAKLTAFCKERSTKLALEQEKNPNVAQYVVTNDDGSKLPYLGAIGGGMTYCFTPTSLGDVVKVTIFGGTTHEATIDLTDYDSW